MQAYNNANDLNISHILLEIKVIFPELAHNTTLQQSRTFRSLVCSLPCLLFYGTKASIVSGPPHYRGFTVTLGRITLGRTALDEWSARHRELYLATHNTHKRQDIRAPGIRTRNSSKRVTADPHLRPRGHRDWLSCTLLQQRQRIETWLFI